MKYSSGELATTSNFHSQLPSMLRFRWDFVPFINWRWDVFWSNWARSHCRLGEQPPSEIIWEIVLCEKPSSFLFISTRFATAKADVSAGEKFPFTHECHRQLSSFPSSLLGGVEIVSSVGAACMAGELHVPSALFTDIFWRNEAKFLSHCRIPRVVLEQHWRWGRMKLKKKAHPLTLHIQFHTILYLFLLELKTFRLPSFGVAN